MKRDVIWSVFAAVALMVVTVGSRVAAAGEQPPTYTAQLVRNILNLDYPECAVYDPGTRQVFISNMVAAPDPKRAWDDDRMGFISLATAKGRMQQLRWLDSSATQPLNSPKGMCILGGFLYFTDNTHVYRRTTTVNRPLEELLVKRAKKLNDITTDGHYIYISDTALNIIQRIDWQGHYAELKAPKGVNGLTFSGDRLLAVSGPLHDIFEVDPMGKFRPKAFGLAAHFKALDGIEALADGTLIVSDFDGNKVFTVCPAGKLVKPLVDVQKPTDIGLNREQNLLYVPQYGAAQVGVYQLNKDDGEE